MKLLVISAAFPPVAAGESDYALHFCRHLAQRGVEVDILTGEGNTTANVEPLRVHPMMRDWGWRDLPRLTGALKRCAHQGVLLMYTGRLYRYHPMITMAPMLAKRLCPRAPFVTQFSVDHGSRPHQTSLLSRMALKGARWFHRGVNYKYGTLLSGSDGIIVLSDHHRQTLVKADPSVNDKIALLPPPPLVRMCENANGDARRRRREQLGVRPDEFLLIHFGYVYQGKGIETLLEAMSQLIAAQRSVRLVLVGGVAPFAAAYVEELKERTRAWGIEKFVTWTGEYASDSDEASLYLRAADACVLPFDGGVQLNNSSLAAAITHGLPVITTQHERLESQFVHQCNVWLFPPQDAASLAAAVEMVMDDSDVRTQLIRGARQLADEWFSWDRTIERTLTMLNGVHKG